MHKKNWDRSSERGNALVYVLIAIALFAGLGMVLSNSTRNSNTSELDDAQAEFYAAQLIGYAAQTKSVLDQMQFTGSSIDDLDFTLPTEAGFNTPPHAHKVFHPLGGGLSLPNIPEKAINELSNSNPAGWYLGRFNNVEWTKSTNTDVILTAYQLTKKVCEKINEQIKNDASIPATTTPYVRHPIIDDSGSVDLDTTSCPGCDGMFSLCVKRSDGVAFAFYTVVADR